MHILDGPLAAMERELEPDAIQRLSALRGKVAIGRPLGKTPIQPTSAVCWTQLVLYSQAVLMPLLHCAAWRMPVAATRTALAEQFLSSSCEWLFMVDSDMVFPPTALCRLLLTAMEDSRISVLSGTARKAGMTAPDRNPTIYRRDALGRHVPMRSWPRHSVFRIDRCGLFGLIIHRGVLEELGPPWFEFPAEGGLDECFFFCDRLAQKNIPIHVDPTVAFGHIGEAIVWGEPDYWEGEEAIERKRPQLYNYHSAYDCDTCTNTECQTRGIGCS